MLVRVRPVVDGLPPVAAAIVADAFTEGYLACGERVAAARCAIDAVTRTPADDPLAQVITATARLRVLAAAGELELARDALTVAVAAARLARAPIRRLRAVALWCAAVQSLGDGAVWRDETRRARRLLRVMPPLVAREMVSARRAPADRTAAGAVVPRRLRELVAITQVEGRDVLRSALPVARSLLGVPRAEVWLPGEHAPHITSGDGSPSRVAQAAIASGAPSHAAPHVAVPIRYEGAIVGGLAIRAADATPGTEVDDWLGVIADQLAPHVDARRQALRDDVHTDGADVGLLGASSAMGAIRNAVLRAARAPFAVLIEGESGVGKEVVARAIHRLSPRADARFCDVNCAAIPDDLFETELFGHAKGAFTGAASERVGLFEEAHRGTLFLDEVAELSPRAQAKLLRAIQQQEVRRVGETISRSVDVRLVAAANRRLADEVAAGRFRADLRYRLDVIHIVIPPLRERPGDVVVLARALWRVAASGVGSSARLTPSLLDVLAAYAWPGNVRELQNVLAAVAVTAPRRGRVGPEWLPPLVRQSEAPALPTLSVARETFEREFVRDAVARAGGNHTKAARQMGLSRQGLLKMLLRLGLRGL